MPILRLSAHAEAEIVRRKLDRQWVERVASAADWTEPDPNDPSLTRAYARLAEAGNRIMRVVYKDVGDERLVVTAFFDRGARRRISGGSG